MLVVAGDVSQSATINVWWLFGLLILAIWIAQLVWFAAEYTRAMRQHPREEGCADEERDGHDQVLIFNRHQGLPT